MNQRIHRALVALGLVMQFGVPTQARSQVGEFAAQAALFNYDSTIPLGVKEAGAQRVGGATVRDITFNALSGADVKAYVIQPGGKGPFPGVLWVHWLGEPETTNRREFLKEAAALASRGIASVLVDAMWAEPDFYGKRNPEHDYDNTIRQVISLRRGMDLLLAQSGVDPGRVAFVGHDYGGMFGMLMAGIDPRAKTYVYVAVVPSLSDWAFFGAQPRSKTEYLRRNAVFELTDYLRQVKNATTLLQFGSRDVYVARASTGVVAAAARTRDRKFYEAGHDMNLPQIVEDRDAWLLKELGVSLVAPEPAVKK